MPSFVPMAMFSSHVQSLIPFIAARDHPGTAMQGVDPQGTSILSHGQGWQGWHYHMGRTGTITSAGLAGLALSHGQDWHYHMGRAGTITWAGLALSHGQGWHYHMGRLALDLCMMCMCDSHRYISVGGVIGIQTALTKDCQ